MHASKAGDAWVTATTQLHYDGNSLVLFNGISLEYRDLT